MLGHNGYTLTCSVSGAENLNPFVTYQWTKDNGTQTQIQDGSDPRTISFTPLRLSDVGRYTCQASISSPYLNSDIIETGFLDVTILSKFVFINNHINIISILYTVKTSEK